MPKARLLIADDHQMVTDGMRRLLEPDFEIAGAVCDGRKAVEEFERLRPDLTLLDIGLPLLNGIEVARRIKRISPGALIVFVTMQTDRIYIEEAFRAGGAGYVLKQSAGSELVEAARAVLSGRTYISPLIAQQPEGGPGNGGGETRITFGGRLTPRQREVLQLIAEGKSMKEIGAILRISVRTVEFHKAGIMEQLGLRSTAEMTRYALSHGILASHVWR